METFYPERVFEKIKEFIQDSENILLLSHLDADGLSSAGLMSNLLKNYDKNFTIRILKQLEDDEDFKHNHDLIIITDMGSGQLNLIKPYLKDKKFIIVDHHQIQGSLKDSNLVHFNPGLDDDSYSASSLTYLIVKELKPELEHLLYLALVGANGDMQNKNGFKGFNKELLNYGLENDYLEVNKGLDIYGRVSKPLHESLAYSFELEIPGISGNESAAIEFLSELNIDLKSENGKWKTLSTLEEGERKKLISNIIIKRLAHDLDSNIVSEIIKVKNGNELLTDLKEWGVLLNACGRLGKYDLGVVLCMGYDNYALPLVQKVVKDYKTLIAKTINKVKRDKSLIEKDEGLLIINGGSEVLDTIIGTVGGMLLKSDEYNAHTFIGFADRPEEGVVKVSCRTRNKNLNLGGLIKETCKSLNCTGGGHKLAGGALVKKGQENGFLNIFRKKVRETLIR